MDAFAEGFALIKAGAGASEITWEVATRCDCYSADTKQPNRAHAACGGLGARYAAPVIIRALFRGQARWVGKKPQGELAHGEAMLSTLDVAHKPNYTDGRIKDRFTVVSATDDSVRGRVFYPAAQPTPFIIGNVHRGWRVQLQAAEQANRTVAQP